MIENSRSLNREMADCPIRNVIAGIGDKWSILVVGELMHGSRRFSELKAAIPDISHRMLTQTLRKLEREGLLTRTVTPTSPPRVDYQLTEIGLSLVNHLLAIADWASSNREDIENARKAFDNLDT